MKQAFCHAINSSHSLDRISTTTVVKYALRLGRLNFQCWLFQALSVRSTRFQIVMGVRPLQYRCTSELITQGLFGSSRYRWSNGVYAREETYNKLSLTFDVLFLFTSKQFFHFLSLLHSFDDNASFNSDFCSYGSSSWLCLPGFDWGHTLSNWDELYFQPGYCALWLSSFWLHPFF